MGEFLLVTIQVDMHDRLAMALEEDLTAKIAATGARGVLIEISALEIVDSFIGRMLDNIAAISRVLDAETVVVGMRPAVAITLVELGLTLTGIKTALNVERGMALIQARLTANGIEGSSQDLQAAGQKMPDVIQGPFSDAMGQTLYMPVLAFLVGIVLVLFLARPTHAGHGGAAARPEAAEPVTAP